MNSEMNSEMYSDSEDWSMAHKSMMEEMDVAKLHRAALSLTFVHHATEASNLPSNAH